jgi:hypothetical protein
MTAVEAAAVEISGETSAVEVVDSAELVVMVVRSGHSGLPPQRKDSIAAGVGVTATTTVEEEGTNTEVVIEEALPLGIEIVLQERKGGLSGSSPGGYRSASPVGYRKRNGSRSRSPPCYRDDRRGGYSMGVCPPRAAGGASNSGAGAGVGRYDDRSSGRYADGRERCDDWGGDPRSVP